MPVPAAHPDQGPRGGAPHHPGGQGHGGPADSRAGPRNGGTPGGRAGPGAGCSTPAGPYTLPLGPVLPLS